MADKNQFRSAVILSFCFGLFTLLFPTGVEKVCSNQSKGARGQISLLFQRFWGDVFCNKSCTVHYIINVISKAGTDVVRTITSINYLSLVLSI